MRSQSTSDWRREEDAMTLRTFTTLTGSAAVAVVLAWVVTFLPGLRKIQIAEAAGAPPLPHYVEASAPAQQAAATCNVVARIVRECPLAGMAAVRTLEDQVIADALAIHKLPASDPQPISEGSLNLGALTNADRLLVWQKDELRALLFDKFVTILDKVPTTRTADEQAIVDALAAKVGQQRLLAATEAKRYYDLWQASPCTFVPPVGTTYTPPQACSIPNSLGAIFQNPPSFEQFQAYGAASAYGRFQTDADLQAAAFETADAYGLLGGLAAVGIAGAVVYTVVVNTTLAAALVTAIVPYTSAAIASAALAIAGLVVAAAAAVPIIVIAVAAAVIAGITVFTNEQTPAKLDDAIAAARTPPNLRPVLDTEAGKQEIFGAFLLTTFDAPLGPASNQVTLDRSPYLPQPGANEARFLLDPGPSERASDELVYKSWDKGGRVRMASGWFVDQVAGGERFASLSIDYLNHAGEQWTAWRIGDRFLHTTAGNVKPAFTSDSIQYQDPDGANHTAKYLPGGAGGALPVTVVTGTGTLPAFEPVPVLGMYAEFFRLLNPTTGDHFYTTDAAERDTAIQRHGYVDEGTEALVGPVAAPGLVPFYRLWNGRFHLYTTDAAERDTAIQRHGYVSEGIAAHVAATPLPGTVPLYRAYNPERGDHLYTTRVAEFDYLTPAPYVSEGIAAYVAPSTAPTPVRVRMTAALYRLYKHASGDHFYTTDAAERDTAIQRHGYVSEGIAAHVAPAPGPGLVQLYRLFNAALDNHLLTADRTERDTVLRNGYVADPFVAYVSATEQAGLVPLYRLYNPGLSNHFYTVDATEKATALRNGWRDEGVVGYVAPAMP
jgi:hypothetical protein